MSEQRAKRGPIWEYVDATGVTRRGEWLSFSDFGGSDIVYQFRRLDSDKIDVVSGGRLKAARRVWGEVQ